MRNAYAISLACLAVLAAPCLAQRARPGQATTPRQDPAADTATHEEIASLAVAFRKLTSICMHPDGRLLACDSGASAIKIIGSDGRLSRTIDLPFSPEGLVVADDGTVYVGGSSQLARLDGEGKVVRQVDAPTGAETPPDRQKRARQRGIRVAGMAVTRDYLFVTFGSGWSLSAKAKLYRFTRDLESPSLLADGLRGCCQRCDIASRDGTIYLAENTAHRVVKYDTDGKVLAKWGSRGRTGLDGFGSCCNPMNLCFDAAGNLYTAESGLGRVKRSTPDGQFLDLVGYAGVTRFSNAGGLAASCSNIAIAATPDGDRVYLMDYKDNKIRVLQKKGSP